MGASVAVTINVTAGSGVANTITLSNPTGADITNYPLQVARPFLAGAFPHAPQFTIAGSPITTQADVKQRYADGSAKHVILAAVIPSIPAGGSVVLGFQDNPTPDNTPLTVAQMAGMDFDAVLSVTGTAAGATAQTVSALAMLQAGDYALWTSGQVAQTIALGDDSAVRTYDIGFGDGFHPLRPRFYATFWPALGAVHVRVVAEGDLVAELEDMAYTASVTLGAATPTVAYTVDLTGTQATNKKLHWAMSNWTKRFWLGYTEPQVNIDHNLAYLTSTRFLPNFDMSLAVPEAAIEAEYTLWTGHAHDIYDGTWDGGMWMSPMPSAGARQDIAPYPQWTAQWLYTGDYRMREIALGLADIAAAYPGNLREIVAGKRLSRADTVGSSTGLGRAVSITDRPTLVTKVLTYSATKAADKVVFVGAYNSGQPWEFDEAHQPAAFYPQYLLTGDPWYLQCMYLWNGYSAAAYNGASINTNAGRGPTGSEGGINDELRGAAWHIRNRAEAAFIAPDADPEQAWLRYLTNDALARWEGSFGINGTAYDGTTEKLWGARTGNYYSTNGGPDSSRMPPFGNWQSNGNPNGKDATITGNTAQHLWDVRSDGQPIVGSFVACWMAWYLQYALGRVAELGFAAGPLRAQTGLYPVGMILDSGYPHLIGSYEVPVEYNYTPLGATSGESIPPGGWMDTWAKVTGSLTPAFLTSVGWQSTWNSGAGDLDTYYAAQLQADGRVIWLAGGLAMMVDAGDPRAATAWAWYKPTVYDAISLDSNPKWAIVPRTDSNVLPAIPTVVP